MSRYRSPNPTLSAVLDSLADWFLKPQTKPLAKRAGRNAARRLTFESLDARVVLSANPGALIEGTVFNDLTGGGQVSDGPGVGGVTVSLYLSTGGNTFQGPGVGNTLAGTTSTDSSGHYSFTGLSAGTYFVQETTPTGYLSAVPNGVETVVVSSAAAQGTTAVSIDSFTTAQSVTASSVGSTSAANGIAAPEALGGYRDLIATLNTGAIGDISLTTDAFNQPVLEFNSSATGAGILDVDWDGNNATPATIDPTGLGSVDLTGGGAATGIGLTLGADHASSITLTIYKDASDWSVATVPLSNTGGSASQTAFVPFSSFSTGGGSGAGNFTSVGAVQLKIDDSQAINGQIATIGAVGPTPFVENFALDQPDLSITKVDNVGGSSISSAHGSAVPGNSITYTIVATNSGPGAVTGATIADTFPAAVTSDTWTATASGGANGFSASGSGNIDDAAVNLPVDSTVTYIVTAQINPAASGTLSNTATITPPAGLTDPTPANNTATDVDNLTGIADLSITKVDNKGGSSVASTQGSVVPGNSLTYTIVVSNGGPSAVIGATVSDPLPAGIASDTWTATATGGASGFSASGSGSIDDTAIDMPIGSTITYTVTATVSPSASGTLSNTATVSPPAGTSDPTPGNNSATDSDTLTPTADLSITKVDNKGGSSITTAHGSLAAGSSLIYTIVVANSGPGTAAGATVSDVVPAGISSDTWTATATGGATGFSASGSGNIADTVDMPVGSTITYTVTAAVNASTSGNLSNTATVTPPEGTTDPTPSNDTATDVDAVTPIADLSITKVDSAGGSSVTSAQGSVVAGGSFTYTIVVTNAGSTAVSGAVVTDAMPSTISSDTYTATGTGGASGFTASGSGNIADASVNLPVGSTITYTVQAVVSSSASSSIINTATVTVPSDTTDVNPANNTATDVDNITQPASVSGTVFVDLNKNGLQDSSDPGIPAVTVQLLAQGNSTPTATTTTNNSGVYLFTGVTPGSYSIKVVLPNSPTFTTQNVAGTPNSNVGISGTNAGETADFTVGAGQSVVTSDDLTNAGVDPKLSKYYFLGR